MSVETVTVFLTTQPIHNCDLPYRPRNSGALRVLKWLRRKDLKCHVEGESVLAPLDLRANVFTSM